MTGTVFNIQSYSLHDGPGIRTIVFLKGCPLQCMWCSNPESQKKAPQIYFDEKKCIRDKGCGLCADACRYGAVSGEGIDFKRCTDCGKCAEVCPSRAVGIYGEAMTAEAVIERVQRESSFYRHGGGGITLSGGEPFMQGEFSIELLRLAKERRINTAAETCGYCDREILHRAAELLDHIMFDIKILNEEKHIRYTGASNRVILDNLDMLFDEFPKLHKHIRTPVIPTVNDNEEDIGDIIRYLKGRDNCSYELLPYHRFGQEKYKLLGREYPALPERLDEEKFEKLKAIL
ncbi:MAG: glycyl-radical enzyme activating protein [Oscillospiraceae bacterium]